MRVNTERFKARERAYEAGMQGSPVLRFLGEGAVRCTKPVELHMFGYPDEVCVALGLERDTNVAQRLEVRCRKCPECLKHRARLWTARAIDETANSTRTWFGTLTLSPDRQTWARYAAMKRLQERVSDVNDINVWRTAVSLIGNEVTLFLKRVRKVTPFRYLLVTENHKSGLPHFHLLIHEYTGSISKRVLEDRWRFGFSHWRLVADGSEANAGYVCKYLAKSALTRVRASEHYGQPVNRLSTERLLVATRLAEKAIAGIPGPVPGGTGSPESHGEPGKEPQDQLTEFH